MSARERLAASRAARAVGRALARSSNPRSVLRAARLVVPTGSHQIPEEIERFVLHARCLAPRRVCEIGTAACGTTIVLSRLAPSVETIVGVDLEIRNDSAVRALAPRGQRIELIEASSLEPTTVERVRELLGGEPIDVLFIDGSHLYEDARQDFLLYRELVRPGGLIAFHDIVPDHGERYGRQTHNWAGGVPALWRELAERYRTREFVRDPEQDAFGIGVLEFDPAVAYPDR